MGEDNMFDVWLMVYLFLVDKTSDKLTLMPVASS
jgi:hypothetical protein